MFIHHRLTKRNGSFYSTKRFVPMGIVMAVGKAGEPADRDRLSIWFGDNRLAHG